ncbi:MAG: ATP-binding cassette domain-containing protein [Raoultibacter sp.]
MLEARDLSFAHAARKASAPPLFSNFNLQLAPGERVALSAPSGAGKTTLCRLLAGYEKPQAGSIVLDGKPLGARGVCPVQMIWQHPETAVDPRMRLRASLLEAGPVQEDLCAALGIKAAWMARYPHELSGGELQRFCIARALAANPRYLIADEISTMLDAVTQASIWHFLIQETAARNIGLLFVSHTPALTARIATRIITLA